MIFRPASIITTTALQHRGGLQDLWAGGLLDPGQRQQAVTRCGCISLSAGTGGVEPRLLRGQSVRLPGPARALPPRPHLVAVPGGEALDGQQSVLLHVGSTAGGRTSVIAEFKGLLIKKLSLVGVHYVLNEDSSSSYNISSPLFPLLQSRNPLATRRQIKC